MKKIELLQIQLDVKTDFLKEHFNKLEFQYNFIQWLLEGEKSEILPYVSDLQKLFNLYNMEDVKQVLTD